MFPGPEGELGGPASAVSGPVRRHGHCTQEAAQGTAGTGDETAGEGHGAGREEQDDICRKELKGERAEGRGRHLHTPPDTGMLSHSQINNRNIEYEVKCISL